MVKRPVIKVKIAIKVKVAVRVRRARAQENGTVSLMERMNSIIGKLLLFLMVVKEVKIKNLMFGTVQDAKFATMNVMKIHLVKLL
jgi:hypothetical protein